MLDGPENNNRMKAIFLVGFPRSGTTLVQSLLASIDGVTSFTESHFLDRGMSPDRERPCGYRLHPRTLSRLLAQFVEDNETSTICKDSINRAKELVNSTDAHIELVIPALIDIFEKAATTRDATCWIEKTPDHVLRLDLIERYRPDAKFVHIVRNPIDAIASYRKASVSWGAPSTWRGAAKHWYQTMEASREKLKSQVGSPSPMHLLVRYEDIVRAPNQVMNALCPKLGLNWENEYLERVTTTAAKLVAQRETWKANNFRPIGQTSRSQNQRPPIPVRSCVHLISSLRRYSRLTTSQGVNGYRSKTLNTSKRS